MKQARASGTASAEATALLHQAYAALERECHLRQLSDEVVGHRDPLYTPPPPDDPAAAARERENREFGMVGNVQDAQAQRPSVVPPATPDLTAYLKKQRSGRAGCLRRYAFVAEGRASASAPSAPRGKLLLRAVSASGTLSRDDLKAAFAALEPALLSCYAAGLDRNPSLEGRVYLRLIFLDAVGEPLMVDNGASGLPDPSVIDCAVLQAYSVRLPAGSKGTAVVPFDFTPH